RRGAGAAAIGPIAAALPVIEMRRDGIGVGSASLHMAIVFRRLSGEPFRVQLGRPVRLNRAFDQEPARCALRAVLTMEHAAGDGRGKRVGVMKSPIWAGVIGTKYDHTPIAV